MDLEILAALHNGNLCLTQIKSNCRENVAVGTTIAKMLIEKLKWLTQKTKRQEYKELDPWEKARNMKKGWSKTRLLCHRDPRKFCAWVPGQDLPRKGEGKLRCCKSPLTC